MPLALNETPIDREHRPDAASPGSVLIVEDSKAEQMRMQAILQRFGYDILVADDGAQALALIRSRYVELIISDWRMPQMSGIELCRVLRGEDGPQPYIILITGRNTKTDLIAGMDAGADDFIAKPFASEELRVRLQAGARILRQRRVSEQRSRLLADALEREARTNLTIRDDLALAARMQREFLPPPVSPFRQLTIGTLFEAATQVAGDSYNFFALDENHLGFFLIDVAGHGIAAAMHSFALARLLSPEMGAFKRTGGLAEAGGSGNDRLAAHLAAPHEVVAALNARLAQDDECRHYFTMVCGVLNIDDGDGLLCQAGHPHPLLTEASNRVRRLGHGGFAVGMLDEADYQSFPFHLGHGERLVIYSDGATDCANDNGERFGTQRLARLLAHHHARPLPQMMQGVSQGLRHWRGNQPGEDDTSMLVIDRTLA